MTTFFLVRHAVTSHTGAKLSGWLEGIQLTDEGRDQAEDVAERLSGTRLDAVHPSPIDRAMATAEPIARRHGLEIEVGRALGEVEYGRWTNRSLRSLAKTKLWSRLQQWPSAARFLDGV